MKLFKHDTKKEYGLKITKKYLRLAATYRRFSDRTNPYWDFSVSALVECFNHESNGGLFSANNGYVNGKWNKDLTFAMQLEDIRNGYAAKVEFINSTNRWWIDPALATVVVVKPWFPYAYMLHERQKL